MATVNKIDLNGDTYDIESSALVTTQPTTPSEGAVYYDAVNDVVKVYDGTNWNPISGGGGGSGDVVGPNSSTNGHLAVFDGTTGKAIKDGGAVPTVPTKVSDLTNDSGFITGINSTDVTTALGYTPVNPSALGTAATKNTGTSSGNVPVLDSNGKLATSTLPGVALTDTFTVSTSSDLTSLSSADQGDLAIVTSENKTYVLSQAPYSTAANWKEILAPTGGVTSVNGQTGAVTGIQTTANLKTSLSDNSDSYYPSQKAVKTAVDGKQDSLATQTAYTSKGTATKVPQITTNSLGQVTGITEVTITHPSQVSDTAYASSWDGVTTTAPSKNAVYDKIESLNLPIISATAPATPTEGMIWYDTTNDVLKVYDGTNWVEVGKEYSAGKGISIGDVTINGRKGPSPDGFHVPSVTEWMGLKNIMSGLSLTTGDNWRINLHMPFAGYRDYYNASHSGQGSNGYYWSSSPYSASSDYARHLYLDSSNVDAIDYYYRADGNSVRCFKDSYVTPDSTWTVVQGTLGSAGIFWNQSEGLISITDGTTGYTIMDKNLGATTVYNDGDTLTQANMGYMYQRGNNYGFPSTGTITNTSSTQVDASNYGPTNPYSSDTFIIGSHDWSSVANDDLWGDTTGTYTLNNVINTGVLSVNGQTGDVTVPTATVISGDSGTTYTIKVSNSAPASGTPNTTITFVV